MNGCDEPLPSRYLGIFRSGRSLASKDLPSSRPRPYDAKVVAEDGGHRSPVRQFFPLRPQDPGPSVQRPPRDFVDHAIGLGIVRSWIYNAAIDVADEAGNNCIEIDQKLIEGAYGCCMRGGGDIS